MDLEIKRQLGKSYKKLRESKNFYLKEAAGNDISVPQLSDFENGKTMIGTDRFLAILKNINVSTIEFQNALEKTLEIPDLSLFDNAINQAFMEKNVTRLKAIQNRLIRQIEEQSESKKLRLDLVVVKATIYRLDPSQKVQERYIRFLKNYLLTIKEWGRYEIQILCNCELIFDSRTIRELAHKLINPIQINYQFAYIQHLIIRTLVNTVSTFVNRGDFEFAHEMIDYLDNTDIHEYYLFEKLTFTHAKVLLDFKETGNPASLDTLKRIKDDLIFYGCYKTADFAEKEILDLEAKKRD